MRYCTSCVLPDSRPNLVLGDDGVCNACRSHSIKPNIDWRLREQQFAQLVQNTKLHSSGYDCVVPVSGGKDSTWQILKCLEYGLKPLAVTWKTPARTSIGKLNLENLISLGVDHIDWQISPSVESRFMAKTFKKYGSTAIPMHLAIFSMPLKIAVQFNIPLIIWGENSAVEYGTTDAALMGHRLDRDWLRKFGVTHGTTAKDWIDQDLTDKDLAGYYGPDPDMLERLGTRAIFLGHYFKWDPEETFKVAKEHGFIENKDGARTGFYDYADIDDDFISIHHWMKWYKFGFTRLFDNLSIEIRNNRISRDLAIDIIRTIGDQTPLKDIDKFCDFSGLSKEQFGEIAESFINLAIWKKVDGIWMIPNFLIEDWKWNEIQRNFSTPKL